MRARASGASSCIERLRSFENANLSRAVLEFASLRDAILKGANLNGTELGGAGFLRADVTNADFENADVTSTRLIGLRGRDNGDDAHYAARVGPSGRTPAPGR